MFILKQLLKAAIRIEKKLDELLKLSTVQTSSVANNTAVPMLGPLNQPGQSPCPLCLQPVVYQPVAVPPPPNVGGGDHQVIIRMCGCEPQTTQLPLQQGDIP